MHELDFNEDYILEDDFVLLRPLVAADIDELIHFSVQEPELWKYSLISAAGEGMKKYIEMALQGRTDKREYPFIVWDKRQGKYAGSTRFYDIQLSNRSLQLGFTWYGSAFQGTGLNKRCKMLLLQFAFETIGMDRVEFRADNNNQRSIAAMKSIGCVVEGVLRQNSITSEGRRRDSIILSILRDEWFNGVKDRLLKKIHTV